MSLEVKRKVKEYQDRIVPGRLRELAQLSGSVIAYEVDWKSFGDDLTALNFFDNLAFHRINMAFRHLGSDELTRAAVKVGLKVIRLKNVKDQSEMKIRFSDSVLEMHCAYGLRLEGIYNENDIHKVVIAGL